MSNTFPKNILSKKETILLKRLNTPQRIQDFLNTIPINFEPDGDTLLSVRGVLTKRRAHCIEGALVAAAALWYHGHPPLLLDLKASKEDYDHVVALFKKDDYWGAISKTNHAVLRYREPIYKTIRELALSYFHEYFNDKGEKTLRSYSKPFSLKKYEIAWVVGNENLWDLGAALDDSPHTALITKKQQCNLRRADLLEIQAGKLIQYSPKKSRVV